LKGRPLGSFSKYSHNFDLESFSIDYPLVAEILGYENAGIVFFGTKRETAICESFLTKQQRVRYWNRWVWKE
jgi:hypothetical protein